MFFIRSQWEAKHVVHQCICLFTALLCVYSILECYNVINKCL